MLLRISLLAAAFLLAGCGGKKSTRTYVPPPPPLEPDTARLPDHARPIYVETGLASWYGPPYHHRRAADGEVFDMHAATAAHRTLPFNSIVRVTSLANGRSTVVRITDRGPFVPGRVIDLSLEAAKRIGLWRMGTAPVRIEVLESPEPLEVGGAWAVQVGPFRNSKSASKFRRSLEHRYHNARVLSFRSPIGDWWVRVRVQGDGRSRAQEIAHNSRPHQGNAYLVRLD